MIPVTSHSGFLGNRVKREQEWEAFKTSRRLLAEGSSGGLSAAWIAAIAINAALIAIFIAAIVYCYCRRKNQSGVEGGGGQAVALRHKAENGLLGDKAAIFTVEAERPPPPPTRACGCNSPGCYCSTGDGRRTASVDRRLSDEEGSEEDPPGYPTPATEPIGTPDTEDFWRPDSYGQRSTEEEDDGASLPGAVSPPPVRSPTPQQRHLVYLVSAGGGRDMLGQVWGPPGGNLAEARRLVTSQVAAPDNFIFMDEEMREVPQHMEPLHHLHPSRNLLLKRAFEVKVPPPILIPAMKKLPAYVGPLGICGGPDCSRAAKLKCLDCRNTAYCSTRCMREDRKDHQKRCYKPAWRL